jgi:hypothetical protein
MKEDSYQFRHLNPSFVSSKANIFDFYAKMETYREKFCIVKLQKTIYQFFDMHFKQKTFSF